MLGCGLSVQGRCEFVFMEYLQEILREDRVLENKEFVVTFPAWVAYSWSHSHAL